MTEDEKVGNGGSETESAFLTGLEKEMVPGAGLEPAQSFTPRDFKFYRIG
mgnify:CR=1 FL=1